MGERRADPAGPSPQLPGRRDAAGRGGREEASAPRVPSRAALARARPAPSRSDSARAAPASRARERRAGARAVSLPGQPLRHAPRGRAPSRRRDSRCGSARGRSPQGGRAGHPGHCSPRLSALWLELCSGRAAPEDGVKLQRSKRSLRGWEVACATRAADRAPAAGGPGPDCAGPSPNAPVAPGPESAGCGGRGPFWRRRCCYRLLGRVGGVGVPVYLRPGVHSRERGFP